MAAVKKFHNPQNLPVKICPVCLKPFTWRRKWKKNWADVKYCSDACRKRKATHL
ncbi:MAG: DUF2256 domain-containing protein [Blastocatellia bacterium]|nr:DUF2256 domain-containing protein [Blastocatellia bacterium]